MKHSFTWGYCLALLFFLLPFSVSANINSTYTVENTSSITAMDVSPDNSRYAVGTYDSTVFVYDNNNQLIYRFESKNVINDLTILKDNSIIIASDDRNLYSYDSRGNEQFIKSFPISPKSVSSSISGDIIATYLASSNEVILINQNGEEIDTINTGFYIEDLSVSKNGKWIVTAGADQVIRVYNSSSELQREIPVTGVINDIKVDDEGRVVVGTENSKVVGFDERGNTLFNYSAKWKITNIDLSTDSNYIAASDLEGNFYIIDKQGNLLWSMQGESIARSVAFSGESLFTGMENGKVQVLNVANIIKDAEREELVETIWKVVVLILAIGMLFAIGWLLVRYKKKLLRDIWRARYIYLVLLPSVVLIGVFLYYPAITGLVYSFYEWNPGSQSHFIGLENYKRMFQDQYVIEGLKNLLILMVTGIIKFMLPPLLVAELLFWLRNNAATYWFRTVFVSSMVLPAVANILIWQNIYSGESGLLNEFLAIIGLGNYAQAWLANPDTALWAIIFIGFPFISILHLLVYYAGLISISSELKDAAMIDGASKFRIIRSIHLPLLKGQFKLLIVMTIIMLIQDFNAMLIITGGGPGTSTYVPALQMYYAATKFSEMGYASAIGVMLFFMIFVITVINLKFVKSQED
ncbi:ABC transporter permease subunit [Aquibacillus saliphilus]|uniref:ABC transporter permease subunit n=1 Tax=Aquibacillus saliphilus TaxID=1909422 RepID=UPI001CF02FC9|nr:ABC transporter permease subunit [Aquibacillus saliphilus]